MYDVAIIGAGVAGTFIARELSRYKLNTVMIDKENDVGNETTAANSAIVHAGYDAAHGKDKAVYSTKGNLMYDQICRDLDVPMKRCGSLVIAFDEHQMINLQKLYLNGTKNGTPNMRMVFRDEVLEMEPHLNKHIVGALHAPTAGIISPFELSIHLAENAINNGSELKLNHSVHNIEKNTDGTFTIMTSKGDIKAKYIVNCAGVFADAIYNMVGDPYFKIMPRKGNYFIYDKSIGHLVNRVIFQCPSKKGKGVLVSPTVHGNLLVGPDSEFVDDKEDLATDADRLAYIKKHALHTCPDLPNDKIIRSYVGLRATTVADSFTKVSGDFVLGKSPVDGFINVAGFESPGLTSIPAVAHYIVEEIFHDMIPDIEENKDFDPTIKKMIRFAELSDEEKAAVIKENAQFGNVICRCETITEAEIVDVIHREAGATTVKGVKKRCRPGTGRCQGGFCGPRVVEILARELNCHIDDIMYDRETGYILSGKTKAESEEV
jgi:glycerol-3-phosphate dehydrogenase